MLRLLLAVQCMPYAGAALAVAICRSRGMGAQGEGADRAKAYLCLQ